MTEKFDFVWEYSGFLEDGRPAAAHHSGSSAFCNFRGLGLVLQGPMMT